MKRPPSARRTRKLPSRRRLIIQAGTLAFPGTGPKEGYVVVEGDRVARLSRESRQDADITVPDGAVGPGFIDLQVNGAAGCDFLSPTEDGLVAAEAYLLSTGTVAYLPTLISAPEERIRDALAFFAARMHRRRPRILGVHLEGPFLSPVRAGAHRLDHLRTPSIGWIGRLLDDFPGVIRLVTLAPELPGALDVITYLRNRRVRVAVGHTDATYDQAHAAFEHGATLATHVYNAMRPYHHREPGVVGAALEHPAVTCSVIADLIHVHPAALRQVFVMKGPLLTALVTDAIAAAGARGAAPTLGDQVVTIGNGAPRLSNGTLAGSILTMDRAVRNAIDVGGSLSVAWGMASEAPADALEIERPSPPKYPADLVVLDEHNFVAATIMGGHIVYRRGAADQPRVH
jgi:N-acetylglucosamine-6-phosphate deacetylase